MTEMIRIRLFFVNNDIFPGAELNHIRKVQLSLGKCSRVLPIMNVVNTGSVLTESYTFQDQIRGKIPVIFPFIRGVPNAKHDIYFLSDEK